MIEPGGGFIEDQQPRVTVERARKRHLLRLWLCPPVGRRLPPEFATRYGSVEVGARGGVAPPGTVPIAPLEPE